MCCFWWKLEYSAEILNLMGVLLSVAVWQTMQANLACRVCF